MLWGWEGEERWPANRVTAWCHIPSVQLGPAIKVSGWTGSSEGARGPDWALTYEWLHRAVDMLVLFEARGCSEGLAAVGAGMGPGTNML